jgi:hypothetical protein
MPSFVIIENWKRPICKVNAKPLRNTWEEMKKAHRKAKGYDAKIQ